MSTPKCNKMTFSEKIRYLLYSKGLKQSELAKLAGTNEANVSRWIKGIAMPRKQAVERLSAVLEIPSKWLMDDSLDLYGDKNNLLSKSNKITCEQNKPFVQELNEEAESMKDFYSEMLQNKLSDIKKFQECNFSDSKIVSRLIDSICSSINNIILTSMREIDETKEYYTLEAIESNMFSQHYILQKSYFEQMRILIDVIAKCAKTASIKTLKESLEILLVFEKRSKWNKKSIIKDLTEI